MQAVLLAGLLGAVALVIAGVVPGSGARLSHAATGWIAVEVILELVAIAAYALLFLLLFWPFASRPWRLVLVAYTLVMAFALVYLAEHYVTDVLLGWIYAALSVIVVYRILDRREARREQQVFGAEPAVSRA